MTRNRRLWADEGFATLQRRNEACGNCADALLGACQMAYHVVEASVVGHDVGDDARPKAFLRTHIGLFLFDRELSWKWKVKYALAAFGLLGVLRRKWSRLNDC